MTKPSREDYFRGFAILMLEDYLSRKPEDSFCTSFKTQSNKTTAQLSSTAVRLEFLTDKQLRKVVEFANACDLSVKAWLSYMRHETTSYELEGCDETVYVPSGIIVGEIRKSPTYSFYGGIDFDGSVHS